MVHVEAMKARLKDLEARFRALEKSKEDLDREMDEIRRDAEILTKAIREESGPVPDEEVEEPGLAPEEVK
jgi:predicted transcriptional regulator